ncbi:MAG: hypothetical protein IPK19_00275 [Chloroflexi bacterium]|nr:hypothetical protein [Chloroflexota bacterium]
MCTATQTTTLPALQQLAEQWASVLCSYYPDVDPVRVAPPIGEGVRCFYRFVNGQPVSWDLGRLLSLLVDQPAIHDVTLVFNSLRKALRHLMAERDLQTILWISDRLDEWLAQMITRYDTHRVHQSRKRWQDAVQRLSRLNTLSHCVAALNTSLDLQSAFTATVELGRLLTSADVCVFYQCAGECCGCGPTPVRSHLLR